MEVLSRQRQRELKKAFQILIAASAAADDVVLIEQEGMGFQEG